MNRFVLDCSYALAWAFPSEWTTPREATHANLESGSSEALVPPLWFYEVANVLIIAERRGRLTHAQSAKFSASLMALPLLTSDALLVQTFPAVATLAREHKLSAYDAAYLRLAIDEDLPLATLDEPLKKAARKCGVSLIEP